MHTIYYYLMFWLYQIYLLPFRLGYHFLQLRGDTEGMKAMARQRGHKWSNFLLKRTGCPIETVGLENIPQDQAALFVSNHQGEFDIPLLMAVIDRPVAFIAKKELAKVPLLGWWMDACGCVFLDRENRRAALESVKESVAKLNSGHSLVVFPEGTRSDSSDMAEFKKGSLNIALRAQVPIVPAAIKDTYKIKNKNQWNIRKTPIKITFFPPIDPTTLSEAEKDQLTEHVQSIIQSGLDSSPSF